MWHVFFNEISVFRKKKSMENLLNAFQLHPRYNNKSRWVQVPVQRSRFSSSFNIGFLVVWWSSKPIRTSFPFRQYHSLSQPPLNVCVCCTSFQWLLCPQDQLLDLSLLCLIKMNAGVCECLLPSCTTKTRALSATIQVVRAAHLSSSQKT